MRIFFVEGKVSRIFSIFLKKNKKNLNFFCDGKFKALFTIGGGRLSSILNDSVWEGCAVVRKTLTWKSRLIHNLFFCSVLGHFLFDKSFFLSNLMGSSLEEIWQFAAGVFGPRRWRVSRYSRLRNRAKVGPELVGLTPSEPSQELFREIRRWGKRHIPPVPPPGFAP